MDIINIFSGWFKGKSSKSGAPTPSIASSAKKHNARNERQSSNSNETIQETIKSDSNREARKQVSQTLSSSLSCSSDEEYFDAAEILRKPFGPNGHIQGKWENNCLLELDSCQFTHPSKNKTIYIRKQGPGYLLTFDQESFIARVKFDKIEDLNFAGRSKVVKQKLLKKLQIIKIIEDEFSNDSNKAYESLKQVLRNRGRTTAENLDYAEDFFELSKRLGDWRSYSSNLDVLEDLMRNKNISSEINVCVRELLRREKASEERRKELFEMPQPLAINLPIFLKQICEEGIENHRQTLHKKYLHSISKTASSAMADHLSKLHDGSIFFITYKDIELFADLVEMMKEEPFLGLIADAWNAFFKRLEKLMQKAQHNNSQLKHFVPFTNPIYFYLCKSFKELVFEINRKTNISVDRLLEKNKKGKWGLVEAITWPTNSPLNQSLEQQYRFIFVLMKHFEPGNYSNKTKFEYEFKLLQNSLANSDQCSAIPEERLVWIYIFDNAIKNLLAGAEYKMFEPFVTGFTHFVNNTKENQYESFREAAHNDIKYIAQTKPYLSKGGSETIAKQIETFNKVRLAGQSGDHRDLVDVFNRYWENRTSILENIPEKFPHEDFEEKMEKIRQTLYDIAGIVLEKEAPIKEIIKFFRSFNEFLEDLNNVDFSWFIKKDDISKLPPNFVDHNLQLVDEDKNSYKVLNPDLFINSGQKVPRHFLIEIVQELLDIVIQLLRQNKWSDEGCLGAAAYLLSAIKKSFLYLKEQPNYLSFDLFKKESTEPFSSVVEKSDSYEDFKKRIAIVGDSFWYLRKQDEIGIEKALELYKHLNGNSAENVLKNCYYKYLDKFNFYIQEIINKSYDEKISFITEEIKNQALTIKIKNSPFSIFSPNTINGWDAKFKKETLPDLLAGLAAVWSIQASKDIAGTGKSLKPHCIQILCILRLLSVDKDSKGVDKHLAQVLTGQGKSLVLGLLSTLLALMGYKVRTVCYSEYLAMRDQQDFESFFRNFGVCDHITYGTFEKMAFAIITPKVNGRTQYLGDLVKDRIINHSAEQNGLIRQDDVGGTILLIDEVDVFFSDQFYGNTQHFCGTIVIPGLDSIQEKIWEIVKSISSTANFNQINSEVEKFIDTNIEEEKENFIEFNEFLRKPGQYYLLKDENNTTIKKLYTNQSLYKEHLEMMINCAIQVAIGNDKDWFINKFKINDEGIISQRRPDGMYSINSFMGYYNTFNYFRLKKTAFNRKDYQNYGYFNVNCGRISYAKLPAHYPLILGVSGTLTTLHDHEKKAVREFYNINKHSVMPSFFGDSHLNFDSSRDFTVQDSEENWLNKIFSQTNTQINSGRSVIIFFDTDIEIEKFNRKYLAKFDRLRLLTPNTEKLETEKYIDEAGITKTITLATRGMGRGVDYKSSVVVEKNGGVHVIQTFFSLDIKEETQIKGRTARKDYKGSYELILCKEHLIEAGFLGSESNAIGGVNSLHQLHYLSNVGSYGNVISYESLCNARKRKMQEIGLKTSERIKNCEDRHKTTMDYMESFFSN